MTDGPGTKPSHFWAPGMAANRWLIPAGQDTDTFGRVGMKFHFAHRLRPSLAHIATRRRSGRLKPSASLYHTRKSRFPHARRNHGRLPPKTAMHFVIANATFVAAETPQLVAATLSCVFVSKSLASCRSCNWLDGSPCIRFTIRPRCTAGRAPIASAQRWTFL